MPKLLFHLLYDWQKKKKKKLFGDPDSLTHLLEPKNIETFHFPWNLKRLPLLKPHLKHSLCLKVCVVKCSLYIKKKKFSISCVKLTIFPAPDQHWAMWRASRLCAFDCMCAYSWSGSALSQWETGPWWLCDVAGSWLSGGNDGQNISVPPGHTHTHTYRQTHRHTLSHTHTHTHRGITEA